MVKLTDVFMIGKDWSCATTLNYSFSEEDMEEDAAYEFDRDLIDQFDMVLEELAYWYMHNKLGCTNKNYIPLMEQEQKLRKKMDRHFKGNYKKIWFNLAEMKEMANFMIYHKMQEGMERWVLESVISRKNYKGNIERMRRFAGTLEGYNQ